MYQFEPDNESPKFTLQTVPIYSFEGINPSFQFNFTYFDKDVFVGEFSGKYAFDKEEARVFAGDGNRSVTMVRLGIGEKPLVFAHDKTYNFRFLK
jgi:hypothetical protein